MRFRFIRRWIMFCIGMVTVKVFVSLISLDDERLNYSAKHYISETTDNQNEERTDVNGTYVFDNIELTTTTLSEDKQQESLADYLKTYTIDGNRYFPCDNVSRPLSEDITWRKNVYQYVPMQFRDVINHTLLPVNDAFIMKFYYDDRFPEIFIRGTITIHGPGFLPHVYDKTNPVLRWGWAIYNSPWWVFFWYKEFETPLLVKCYLKQSGGLDRLVQKTVYSQHMITCLVPSIDLLPSHASIMRNSTCGSADNFVEIVYPKPAYNDSKHKIGVCMASLFGKMTGQDVPYFVNWMETLYVLGVSEVTMNNASWYFEDSIVYDVFDYYKAKGRLQLTHYPPVHLYWDSPYEDDAATEAINKITTGDCFYRNLKRYWYTLIIDMDEIPVPTYFNTYQEYLLDNFVKYPNHSDDHSLGVRSSFFYLNFTVGNPEYDEHLPVLRMTNRFRVEPMEVDGNGLAKSFHNNKNVVASGHHQVRATYPDKAVKRHTFLNESEILIHHYRKECKWSSYCSEHWNETIHDTRLPSKFGNEIKNNVEFVLQKIGYKYV